VSVNALNIYDISTNRIPTIKADVVKILVTM